MNFGKNDRKDAAIQRAQRRANFRFVSRWLLLIFLGCIIGGWLHAQDWSHGLRGVLTVLWEGKP